MKKFRTIFAVACIVFGVGYLIFSAASAEGIVYKTIDEIRSEGSSGRFYRLKGDAKEGSIIKHSRERRVEFVVIDEAGNEMIVTYQGVVPDTFNDRAEVVVSGHYRPASDLFEATELLAKCPSKYEGGFHDPTHDTTTASH